MNLVKIKLTSSVIIAGNVAGPEDKNNGVYSIEKNIANNLIARKKAIILNGEEQLNGNTSPQFISVTIEEAKAMADALPIKYNPNIGLDTLSKKILAELQEKGKEYSLDLTELDVKKAYELYVKAKADKEQNNNNPPIKLEELIEIAEAAEIDLEDAEDYDKTKEAVGVGLEKYASELKLDIAENSTIKEIWALIEEKLKDNDD